MPPTSEEICSTDLSICAWSQVPPWPNRVKPTHPPPSRPWHQQILATDLSIKPQPTISSAPSIRILNQFLWKLDSRATFSNELIHFGRRPAATDMVRSMHTEISWARRAKQVSSWSPWVEPLPSFFTRGLEWDGLGWDENFWTRLCYEQIDSNQYKMLDLSSIYHSQSLNIE